MKKALFIGRFQPFHKGHLHAVKKIVGKHGAVVIAIGSSQESRTRKNPFTAGERKKMVVASLRGEKKLAGKYSIILVPDLQGDDSEWTRRLLARGDFSVAVTGTRHVARCLSGWLKVERPAFLHRAELNATKIRGMILEGKKWEKLVPAGVARYLQKISAGKIILESSQASSRKKTGVRQAREERRKPRFTGAACF